MVSANCAMLLRSPRRQNTRSLRMFLRQHGKLWAGLNARVALGTRLPAPELRKSEIMFKREAGHPVILHPVILDTRRQGLSRRHPETHHPLSLAVITDAL